MQNRYAGDVGDFGKFGMLRALGQSGLKIGVNWYLVPDESHNNDGKHIGYLENSTFLGCDDELLEILRLLVIEKRRSVDALEHSGLLPDAVFYHGVIYPPRTDGKFVRSEWHSLAISALSDSELVFLDPDNGLLAQSVSHGARASIKYVFEEELTDYYLRGHSVIFYNQRCRLQETAYLERFATLRQNPAFWDSEWFDLKFARGTIRDYFFILRPEHAVAVKKAAEKMLCGDFSRHFSLINF